MPAVLSASGRDNLQSTTSSGTRRAHSLLRSPAVRSSESVHSACLDSITGLPGGRDHSAHFRIMEPPAVTAHTLQGMARVRSGQAPAWPLVSDRSVRSGSRVKRDFACTLTGTFRLCWLPCGHSRAWGWRGGHVHSAGHPRI